MLTIEFLQYPAYLIENLVILPFFLFKYGTKMATFFFVLIYLLFNILISTEASHALGAVVSIAILPFVYCILQGFSIISNLFFIVSLVVEQIILENFQNLLPQSQIQNESPASISIQQLQNKILFSSLFLYITMWINTYTNRKVRNKKYFSRNKNNLNKKFKI